MRAQDLVARAQRWSKEQPWRLFGSQIFILVRNEVRRNLFTRRRIWIYLLALIPALIILTHLIVGVVKDSHYSNVKQELRPVYYLPYKQDTSSMGDMAFYVRGAIDSDITIGGW